MKTSKSFNQEYIEKAQKLIHEILEDKKEYDRNGSHRTFKSQTV